jgi:hypothetical protein
MIETQDIAFLQYTPVIRPAVTKQGKKDNK